MMNPKPYEDGEPQKEHLNGANPPPMPFNMNPPSPAVWGGWGQQKPRIRMPPAMTRLGFPFVPPKAAPLTASEKAAVEFRRGGGSVYNTSAPPPV